MNLLKSFIKPAKITSLIRYLLWIKIEYLLASETFQLLATKILDANGAGETADIILPHQLKGHDRKGARGGLTDI